MNVLYYTTSAFSGLSTWKSSDIFTLGERASLSCSSGLDVTSTKWLHNHLVVGHSSESELQLVFDSVNDSIHNEEFICRTTSPYGIQEQSVRPFVQSELSQVENIKSAIIL